MGYITVIGLEIHAELITETKIFCGCKNAFGHKENENCCSVCTALPGALPFLNQNAVKQSIKAGLALGCKIANDTRWDRKNYFYPDSPKAYQISQLYAPLCIGGGLYINDRFIRLNHIHLEEDAGKLIHDEIRRTTYIDYNRCGVPLIEIVTEPDMRSSDEAIAFIERVRQELIYAGACDGKMEQGSLRVDANISIMKEDATEFGTRTEIKNINSLRNVKAAIDFEVERQISVVEAGGKIVQETRRFNDSTGETTTLRSKENAEDYRYFPDPDILPLKISDQEINEISSELPQSPFKRKDRYINEYGFSEVEADTMLSKKFLSDFFDKSVSDGIDYKIAFNLIKGEFLKQINRSEKEIEQIPFSTDEFKYCIDLLNSSKINQNNLKTTISLLFEGEKTAKEIIEQNKFIVEENTDEIIVVISDVIKNNSKAVEQFKSGDEKVFGFLMGQCNRVLKNQALPQTIKEMLLQELKK